MKTVVLAKLFNRRCIIVSLVCLVVLINQAEAQQFNSDSWLSKPWGTVTIIPTVGQRNSMLMTTYSLFPRWEFTVAGFMYNNDNDPLTNDGYSVSLYAKYMFFENEAGTGGGAVKFGTGMKPGTIGVDYRVKDAFRSYWTNVPVTIPFFENKVSLDLMPGASFTTNYGETKTLAWAFTYSTRLAYNPFDPRWSVVGEIFGSEGQTYAPPEYKAGIRWEPSRYAVFAVTYGQEVHGNHGAGFEFGIMLFTPPFTCFGGCKTPKD